MSLDSTFWLDAPAATAASAQQMLLVTAGFERLADDGGHKRLYAEACTVVIVRPTPPQFTLQDVGIDSTLQFFFVNTDKENTAAWTLNTVRAVMTLLHAFPGDALLLYSTGSPALLRKGGSLILDRRCGLWAPDVEPHVLPLVDVPHSWGTIPLA